MKRFPDNPSVFELQGDLLGRKREFGAAVEALRRSFELDEDQPTVAAELGEYHRRLGDHDAALAWLDRALEADPRSSYALGTKGQVLRARGDPGATAVLREALELAGEPPPGWLVQELASALTEQGSPGSLEEAIEHLDRFLASSPTQVWALAAKAEALRLLERPVEGLAAADAALAINLEAGMPEDEAILGTKVHLLADLLRAPEALAVADRLLATASEERRANSFARSGRIRALLILDRHAEAFAELDRYFQEVGPSDLWGLLTKASALSDYREFRAALDILDALTAPDPFREALVGYCRNRLGDSRSAIEPLARAVQANPGVWWWRAELAEACWRAGDREAADRNFRVLTEAGSSASANDSNLLANAGWAAFRLGDPAAAVGLAQRALLLDPTNPAYRLVLATTLLVAGRGAAAVEEVEAAVRMAADRPDPRRGAAILEESIGDVEQLRSEGALAGQPGEAEEALAILRRQAGRLRQAVPTAVP